MILIASSGLNREIGLNNDLLFYAPQDRKFFKSQTVGNIVIMGRRTFESLPKQQPLPDRVNIVLSSDETFAPDGVTVFHSVDEVLSFVKNITDKKVFVIGGAAIYSTMLPYCNKAIITQFYAESQADRFLPDIMHSTDWQLTDRSERQNYEGLEFTFDIYERIS